MYYYPQEKDIILFKDYFLLSKKKLFRLNHKINMVGSCFFVFFFLNALFFIEGRRAGGPEAKAGNEECSPADNTSFVMNEK